MAALLDRWRRRGASLHLGIGISHGFATVGLVGSEDRWDYAAIGPVTNLAARLCARARAGETLVCERVMSALGLEVVADLVGTFRLRGFRRPHKVFRVCDLGTTEGRAPGAKVRR
jgi:class 3 adenylate cyclase